MSCEGKLLFWKLGFECVCQAPVGAKLTQTQLSQRFLEILWFRVRDWLQEQTFNCTDTLKLGEPLWSCLCGSAGGAVGEVAGRREQSPGRFRECQPWQPGEVLEWVAPLASLPRCVGLWLLLLSWMASEPGGPADPQDSLGTTPQMCAQLG